jgi:hypothetical protein
MYKAVTTTNLIDMAQAGRVHNFNRQVNVQALNGMLDHDKTAVLKLLLFGHNMDNPNDTRPLHHRVLVLAPVKGTDAPLEFQLDVLASDFNQLHDAEKILEQLKK